MLNPFKPCSLTFSERREIVLRNWLRYGYGRRTREIKQISIADKVSNLMYMQIVS